MSWYRTYRPQTIAGLQIKPVREALQRVLQSGEFSHAYLLTGPKGTGKTSAARILAKVLNCEKNRKVIQHRLQATGDRLQKKKEEKTIASSLSTVASLKEPCNVCDSCVAITNGGSLSVTEIDAASNRGIDDIRSLREQIGLTPPDGLISVFIIDEVHMLTTEAFNALLKALEEPPKHVVFILATTDLQKMPATVLSRCTVISYRKATIAELADQLTTIADAEEVKVARSILESIATSADGSFRDAVKLFEQLASGKKELQESDLESATSIGLQRLSADLLTHLLRKDAGKVADIFSTVREKGMDGVAFEREVLTLGHSKLVEFARENDPRLQTIVTLLRAIAEPIDTNLPTVWLPFELACMEFALQGHRGQATGHPPSHKATEGQSRAPSFAQSYGRAKQGTEESVKGEEKQTIEETNEGQATGYRLKVTEEKRDKRRETEENKEVRGQKSEDVQVQGLRLEIKDQGDESPVGITFEQIQQRWQEVMMKVKTRSVPVEGLLKSTRPAGLEGRHLILEASYQFHKDQLEQTKNAVVFEEILSEVFATPLRFQVRIAKVKIQVIPNSGSLAGSEGENLVDVAQEAFL